jgi:hypothetical protein
VVATCIKSSLCSTTDTNNRENVWSNVLLQYVQGHSQKFPDWLHDKIYMHLCYWQFLSPSNYSPSKFMQWTQYFCHCWKHHQNWLSESCVGHSWIFQEFLTCSLEYQGSAQSVQQSWCENYFSIHLLFIEGMSILLRINRLMYPFSNFYLSVPVKTQHYWC